MEKVLHRAGSRGAFDNEWLSTRYSFSFANWYDPKRMGFGALRVINDDVIAPSTGFGEHAHRDMEIITLVTEGTLTHKDSMGNVGTLPKDHVQVMSAGTGVRHAEYNDDDAEPLRLFQIWIEPDRTGVEPRYEEMSLAGDLSAPGLVTLAAPFGSDEGLPIHQRAFVSRLVLDATPYEYALNANLGLYIFVVEGTVQVGDEKLGARDALGVWDTEAVRLATPAHATALLFEVPMHT